MSDLGSQNCASPGERSNLKRAVLVHGAAQSSRSTAGSLLRHVASASDTLIFHFGSSLQDRIAKAPVPWTVTAPVAETGAGEVGTLSSCYGPRLTSGELYSSEKSRFADQGAAVVPRARQLPGSAPAALLARLHDIEGSVKLLRQWEEKTGTIVEQVVLIRSDVAVYQFVDVDLRVGCIGVAQTEGFNPATGRRNARAARLHHFRNRRTGDFVPADRPRSFNCDIIVINRADLDGFNDLYGSAISLLQEGAPPHLETLLYLILVGQRGLQIRTHPKWLYEICREDEPAAFSGSDQVAPTIAGDLQLLPNREANRAMHEGDRKRVAVLLYGLLRTYRTTAGSLIERVVKPSNAALFYYGPEQTDRPTRSHGGSFDEHGFFISNPKGDFDPLASLEKPDLKAAYGSYLKRARTHNVSQEYFERTSREIYPREEWMFMLSPHRLISMFYNMNGVVNLLREYEDDVGYDFDEVIITRPDLAFFTPINPVVKSGELHITDGEGFDVNGHEHRGNAPAYFYKNALNGDYAPAGRRFSFNDQILVLKREDLVHFYEIYDNLLQMLRNRVPGSPETILYLLMVQRAGLSLKSHPEWVHEICRADDAAIKSVSDTPDILHIDPHGPKAARFRSSPPAEATGDVKSAKPQGDALRLMQNLFASAGRPGVWSAMRGRMLLARARKERRAGNLAAAEQHYTKTLRTAPHLQREWVQYGHVLKDQGDWPAAIDAYRLALMLDPDDRETAMHHESAVRHVEAAR